MLTAELLEMKMITQRYSEATRMESNGNYSLHPKFCFTPLFHPEVFGLSDGTLTSCTEERSPSFPFKFRPRIAKRDLLPFLLHFHSRFDVYAYFSNSLTLLEIFFLN